MAVILLFMSAHLTYPYAKVPKHLDGLHLHITTVRSCRHVSARKIEWKNGKAWEEESDQAGLDTCTKSKDRERMPDARYYSLHLHSFWYIPLVEDASSTYIV